MKAPLRYTSIPAALAHHALKRPSRGVHFYDRAGVKSFATWASVLDVAHRMALSMRARGLRPGDKVVMALPNGFDFIHVFLGARTAGVLPIPVMAPRANENVTRALASLGELAARREARALITMSADDSPLLAMAEALGQLDLITSPERLTDPTGDPTPLSALLADLSHDSLAYIQCTSGSTGAPKGVPLTHGNILTNLSDVGRHLQVNKDDVGVSWLPMMHDMGLVGVLLFALCWGVPLVLLDPERFLKAPHEWLWCIHNHGATLSPASDFGYHYCARRARASDLEGLDLSSWRVAMSGSETVDGAHLQAFERRFQPFGLRERVFVPVYGLAEATVAVTFGALDRAVHIDHVSRSTLETSGVALPSEPGADTLALIGLGKALPNVEILLTNQEGERVADRTVGEVHVRGRSAMSGYLGEAPLEEGQWIPTGDLGYTVDGELFVLGRRSEVVNLGQRVVYPHTVETLALRIDGVRAAAVFGVHRSIAARSRHEAIRAVAREGGASNATAEHEEASLHGRECLIVAVEAGEGVDRDSLAEVIERTLQTHLGLTPHDVRVLSPRSIPKTSSGKIRRHLCRELYLNEALDRRDRQERRQALTHIAERARSYVAQLGRRFRSYFDET